MKIHLTAAQKSSIINFIKNDEIEDATTYIREITGCTKREAREEANKIEDYMEEEEAILEAKKNELLNNSDSMESLKPTEGLGLFEPESFDDEDEDY